MILDLSTCLECGPGALRSGPARALVEALQRGALPYTKLTRCRQNAGQDVVEVEVEVELVQYPVHDIRPVEPLAVVFPVPDNALVGPDVWALRPDFSATVPHLNLRPFDWPKSLCLYEEPFRDLHAQWTPARFVARIRDWLRLTARGELHADDQPLEPLLGDWGAWVVLPHTLLTDAAGTAPYMADASTGTGSTASLPLSFAGYPDHHGRPVLVGGPHQPSDAPPKVAAALVRSRPRSQAALRSAPQTLAELDAMLAEEGDDLLGALRASVRNWDRTDDVLRAHPLLVVFVPKLRDGSSVVEVVDTWVFVALKTTVRAFGVAIGVWDDAPGQASSGMLLIPDATRTGADVQLVLCQSVYTLSRASAAELNGRDAPDDRQFVAIGAGALGSQVILNASRAAFGQWTIIDDDLVLPHNLARHAMEAQAIAFPKALTVASVCQGLTRPDGNNLHIVADVLAPGEQAAAVEAALDRAEAIVDLSASVTVARMLARDCGATGRRASVFLNPRGTDLAILAEDAARTVPLDAIEMQYYRALVHQTALADALQLPPGRVRYGHSCRDVSSQLPQALAAVHAGIAAKALEQVLAAPEARLRLWRVDQTSLAVSAIDLVPAPVRTVRQGDWTLMTDTALLDRLAALRLAKLPNETGGVLLGSVDLSRRIVYVVDTIPSPPDSKEWPTLYIRGCVGLEAEVRRIEGITAGQLHYVGEWHSHPAGHSCHPSDKDLTVFGWLTGRLDQDGLPALMVIVGDDMAVPYLGQMLRNGVYPAELRSGGQ